MNRTPRLFAAITVLAFALATPSVQAQILVNDNFDGYANQAAFETVWVPIGTTAPISGTLSTVQSVSAPNSIEILGTATNNQQRNQRVFAETGTPSPTSRIVFSFDFFDSNAAVAPYRQDSNLLDTTAPSATNQLIAMGLNNNQTTANSGGNFYMA